MERLERRLAMMRSTFIAAVMAISSPALADSRPTGLPDFSIEKSCAMFAAHPRPLALCQDEETYYRGQVMGIWTRAPAPGREKCSELASQSERAKYEVLSRCLRAAISEAAWKDAVGTIKP
jgi:hypothetical protein